MKLTKNSQIMTFAKAVFSTLLVILFSAALNSSSAQVKSPEDNKVYDKVDHEPDFPGGIKKFYEFLTQNLKYPADARKDSIQGRVGVSFIVEKDGSLTNVKAGRAISPSLGQEAVRVISLSPKWTPGTQNGQPVRVMYTVPVNFSLSKK